MKFQRPEFLILFIVLAIFYLYVRRKKKISIGLGAVKFYELSTPKFRKYLLAAPEVLLYLILVFSIISSSGFSLSSRYREVYLPGIDVMIIFDISRSMAAEDFAPRNRFEIARTVVEEFIKKREVDRIGLAAFAGAPLLICPLTLDKNFLISSLNALKIGEIEDGTAIGLAIAEGVSDLQSSKTSKVMILLTDGMNNRGEISPIDAAKMAEEAGIKIYTIGVGKKGKAKIPIEAGIGMTYIEKEVSIDEKTLERVAEITGGRYFRAENPQALKTIFKEIDSLEKGEIRVKTEARFRPIYNELDLLIAILFLLWLFLRAIPVEIP